MLKFEKIMRSVVLSMCNMLKIVLYALVVIISLIALRDMGLSNDCVSVIFAMLGVSAISGIIAVVLNIIYRNI